MISPIYGRQKIRAGFISCMSNRKRVIMIPRGVLLPPALPAVKPLKS